MTQNQHEASDQDLADQFQPSDDELNLDSAEAMSNDAVLNEADEEEELQT